MKKIKKEDNNEHVKIYDKYMYTSQEKLKNVVLIILVFLIGFVTGYFSNDTMNKKEIETQNTSSNTQIVDT